VASTEERDRTSVDLRAPVDARAPVVETAPDGDDLVVIPGGTESARSHRFRTQIVAGTVAAVVVVAITIALLVRDDGSTRRVVTLAPPASLVAPVANTPKPSTAPKKPKTSTPVQAPPGSLVASSPVSHAPQVSAPPATAAPAPKTYPPSALRWTVPGAVSITQGKSKQISVTATNPTDGTIALPHPLSCTPRLDHGEMCAQVTQEIGAGQSAHATYTIDATDFGPGSYTLNVEELVTINVTVTP
jgi:hypothetical protein